MIRKEANSYDPKWDIYFEEREGDRKFGSMTGRKLRSDGSETRRRARLPDYDLKESFMSHPAQALIDFKKVKDYLICIDSDDCAFDAMEIKHKECFAPNFINHWELQAVSKYAREVWEFVNLYSDTRGCNRFMAVIPKNVFYASALIHTAAKQQAYVVDAVGFQGKFFFKRLRKKTNF